MEVANTQAIHETISDLVNIRKINSMLGQAFTRPLSNGKIVFDEEKLLGQAQRFKAHVKNRMNVELSMDEAVMTIIVSQCFKNADVDSVLLPEGLSNKIIEEGRVFHLGELEENPYLKNVHLGEHSLGRFTLTKGTYGKYQLLQYNEPEILTGGIGINRLAVIDHDFTYPCIRENDDTWMGVTPNEIFTMDRVVNEVKGNVLTLGLGLGYFAYMAAIKDDVSHVTVVEREPEVIELFNKYILPEFGCADKITVVQADAIEYMKELEDGEYDYCFADIWISNTDASSYIKLKKACRNFRKMQMRYWIENSILFSLVPYVVIDMVEAGYKHLGQEAPDVQVASEEEQFKQKTIKELLKDVNIERPQQLMWYADQRNLKNLI